jgi:hypothetical protein
MFRFQILEPLILMISLKVLEEPGSILERIIDHKNKDINGVRTDNIPMMM